MDGAIDDGAHTAKRRDGDELEELMRVAASGCHDAFSRLYQLTHRRLFAIVLRFVRQRALAEEVLQDIYVKVWFRSHQFDPHKGQAMPWLASVAKRSALDALRAATVRPIESHNDDDESPYEHVVSKTETPIECCESAQRAVQVRRQIDALPANQSESLLLAFFDELTHQEISSVLGCPLGTVKSRVRRALQSLRPGLQALC